ncbi:MAG: hypothetical protein OXI81_10580 [Paracoccaceae bacterium]|nr:hypothetical protein [Paracoccaceae bacterium]
MTGRLTRRGALAFAVAAPPPAMAAETIKAVVIDGYPERALWVKEFSNFFIPEVDKRLAAPVTTRWSGRRAMAVRSSTPRAFLKASNWVLATSES